MATKTQTNSVTRKKMWYYSVRKIGAYLEFRKKVSRGEEATTKS